MNRTLLITGIIYGAGKRDALSCSKSLWRGFERGVVHVATELDKRYHNVPECTGDITCERTGVRHKTGCLGRVERIDVFWKKVQG